VSVSGTPPHKPEFDVELPSDRMTDVCERWDDIYTVDRLTDMHLSNIQSKRYEFEAEVIEVNPYHDRGERVNPAMAKMMGREPYTHEQLREARRRIEDKADRVRARFEQAEGIKQEHEQERWHTFLTSLVERANFDITIFNYEQ
jgi:hypothetical protein